MHPTGEFCPSCGRGAFLVAGTSLDADDAARHLRPDVLSHERRWDDGSSARYGLEGGDGPAWHAQLEVAGQRCLYNLTSFLGRRHLEHLLDHFRFVEGIGA